MGKTFFIETWGCQMNDLDTQRIAGQLKLRGYRRVEREHEANLLLLNTCSIREKSEQKVFSRLGELREVKSGSGARIGVLGCVAQQEGENLIDRVPFVDFVIGTGNVGQLDDVLDGSRRVAIDFPEERTYDYLAIDRPSAVRAQVTIIEGCNHNCTFCIVPTTRGREISRTLQDIVREIEVAAESGRVEIELLGQTVNAYRCPRTGSDFADLLERVARTPGVLRVRFMTSHPIDMTRRTVEVMRDHANICRFLHLPVQSGSSAVLRRMKRLYTRERYMEIMNELRREIPTMRFSTDIIVGFPGETDADFEQTMSLLEEVRYGSIFAFKYSPRPATPALRLPGEVDDEVASERLSRVFALQERISREILTGYVGQTIEVLYEGPSRHDSGVSAGKSDDNLTVNFTCHRSLHPGALVKVAVTGAGHHTLKGEMVE